MKERFQEAEGILQLRMAVIYLATVAKLSRKAPYRYGSYYIGHDVLEMAAFEVTLRTEHSPAFYQLQLPMTRQHQHAIFTAGTYSRCVCA